ncbi:Membrane fusion component of tripartite multidrug resistance system [Rhodovastum atsumiense]|uniref:HlyD family secretion protein n=1 Tax=Rhodovastum atsumiense TaxID=504468 RepID=A0A5M6IQ34_9PROT|nr:HlyD family secretion protein [Rhodovastum atsumiense]KAA5610017.1 HlyD family secretion protein [Rhodovastum atsumiense]CAH2602998.1 Membrane fusion component of tripartite multidrug resistance system [Rhodovastum atsumiense]
MSDATADDCLAVPRQPAPALPWRRARPRLRAWLTLGGLAAMAAAVATWLAGGHGVTIDNAYVRARKVAVSTDVGGIVQSVEVRNGSRVAAGDVLFRLDPRPFDIALDAARATLAQVGQQIEATRQDYQRLLRDIAAQEAMLAAEQAGQERTAPPEPGDAAGRDAAQFRRSAGRAALESLKLQAATLLARLGGDPDIPAARTPEYRHALAQVQEAERQREHSVVRAPFAAVATQVDALQPGMALAPAAAAFGLIATDDAWIEASPRETDLAPIRTGDPARVRVDAYPGRVWNGTVEGIAPGSFSEFTLLPPQNASANWVRVVQRIPLWVRLDPQPDAPELRAGMSAVVEIDPPARRPARLAQGAAAPP